MDENNLDDLLTMRPDALPPLDREQFTFAYQYANSAASLTTPVENPELQSINIKDDEDSFTIQITDNPLSRALCAAKNHFVDDQRLTFNFSVRFLALVRLLDSKELKEYVRGDDMDEAILMIHPAVLYAAAETPLNSEGEFNKEALLYAIKKIAEEG